jgi:hypothetical protein
VGIIPSLRRKKGNLLHKVEVSFYSPAPLLRIGRPRPFFMTSESEPQAAGRIKGSFCILASPSIEKEQQ